MLIFCPDYPGQQLLTEIENTINHLSLWRHILIM